MLSDTLKTLVQRVTPKKGLTALAGMLAECKIAWVKNWLIKCFIRTYNVDMQEALEENSKAYPNFNAFFIRKLKPSVRSIASSDLICPVDGYVSELGHIQKGQILQAKQRTYSVSELLGFDDAMTNLFSTGSYTTLYLSPKDYHRVHMPIAATLKQMIYLPGRLFSVQPATTRTIQDLFSKNRRVAVLYETDLGPMAMVLVGATIVGKVGTAWHGDIKSARKTTHWVYPKTKSTKLDFQKGQEMGYFKLGSTVILLFTDKASVAWDTTLKPGVAVKLGQALGSVDRP